MSEYRFGRIIVRQQPRNLGKIGRVAYDNGLEGENYKIFRKTGININNEHLKLIFDYDI